MKINKDSKASYVNAERVSRGLAHIAPNEVRIDFKDAFEGQRLMEALAHDFSIYQWTDGVPYDEKYDLFFWCNDLYNTVGHNCSGRDLRQISLGPNKKKGVSEQEEIYDRLRKFLTAWDDGGNGEAYFTWHSVNDFAAIKSRAERILALIEQGSFVLWRGMKGRIKYSHTNGYYFMKAGARRNGYLLDWEKILDVRTLEGKEFAA